MAIAGSTCAIPIIAQLRHIHREEAQVDRALPEYREAVRFLQQDLRTSTPAGPFHLMLCRYLVFTYFDDALQREVLQRMTERLIPGRALVIGAVETLPGGVSGLAPWSKKQLGIYRKLP